ncbi:fibronectin type III domain-containing protein [bacterium]|nr:fibronectin type III domain-containing protein [bacterium]
MKRQNHLKAVLLLAALLTGCGGAGNSLSSTAGAPVEEPGRIAARRDGFVLRVLDESFRYGGASDFQLQVTRSGAETLVSVSSQNASDLRAAFLELEYDSRDSHPLETRPSDWPAGDGALLHLSLLNEPARANGRATAYFAAVLPELDTNSGASGSFEIVSFRFVPGPATVQRSSSKAPKAEPSRIPDLDVDTDSGSVTFSYYNVGDYNQDGRVAVSDLTPIGIRFGDQVPEASPNSIEAVVDGSADGRINVQDLTPIGLNFLTRVDAFEIYRGTQEDYDAGDNGAAELLLSFPFAPGAGSPEVQRLGDPSQVRLGYDASVSALIEPEDSLVWVRPVSDPSGTAESGIASNSVNVSGGITGDIIAPVWTDFQNPGIISVDAGDGSANVTWGEATDATSPPVSYRVYFNEGGTVDFNSTSFLSFPAGTLSGQVTGLTNGTQYAFAVRAQDSATPNPNVDRNSRTLLATPLGTELLPATISEDTTFTNPVLVPDAEISEVEDCSVLTFSNDLTIDGELKAVDCDLYIIVEGDLTVNGKLTLQTSTPNPAGSGNDAWSIKIEAHGDVTFGPDSQLENAGNFYLVESPAELVDPQSVVTDTDTDMNPGSYPFTLMHEQQGGPLREGSQLRSQGLTFSGGSPRGLESRSASAAEHIWQLSGDWGQQPLASPGVQRVVYRIYANDADINCTEWSLTGPAGRPAPDVTDCSAFGARGGDAYRLRIHSGEQLSFSNVSLSMAEGGRGGNASAPVCCPAFAQGGQGGLPGRFRFTSATGIALENGSLDIDPGKGGDGGAAVAIGAAGTNGCEATEGCLASAEGGDGADVFFGIFVRGEVAGLSSLNLAAVRAGHGGSATALGGDGGLNLCPCGGTGGNGGDATAIGGEGGDASFGALAGTSGGGATSGDGGAAISTGGLGQAGGACLKVEAGGDGGDGGAATSQGGQAGAASGTDVLLTEGAEGSAQASGGNGGNGGDGCNGGAPGPGGQAVALGADPQQNSGLNGFSGEDVCPVEWFIPLSSILPEDSGPGPEYIADGFSGDAVLFSLSTLTQVGTVPFTWHVPVANGAFWDTDLLSNTTYFQMQNTSSDQTVSLEMDFSQVNLTEGDPLGLLSSRLFIRENRELLATTLGGYLDLRDPGDLSTMYLGALDEVTHLPGDDPVEQNLDFGGLMPDPIWRIACPPNWTTAIQLIYITDP